MSCALNNQTFLHGTKKKINNFLNILTFYFQYIVGITETFPIAYATYISVKYKVHVVQYVDFSAS